jgi:hypothetical protein
LTFDLWAWLLQRAIKIAPSNFCLIDRWVLYMPEGIFRHSNIGVTSRKNGECMVGWIAHYLTGILFAIVFVTLAGMDWLQRPTLIPALVLGIVTVSMPFYILQPAFGLGIASSKTAKPMQARLRSLTNHTVFGFGLYLFGSLINWYI